MKKIMLAVLCIGMTTMGCMADNKGQHKPSDKPQHEQQAPQRQVAPGHAVAQHRQKAMPRQSQHAMHIDPVFDMQLVGQMGLSAKKIQKISALKHLRDEEIARLHASRSMNKEHRAQRHAINEKYRRQLKSIMGSKTYTRYIERINDRLAAHRATHLRRSDMHTTVRPAMKPMAMHRD